MKGEILVDERKSLEVNEEISDLLVGMGVKSETKLPVEVEEFSMYVWVILACGVLTLDLILFFGWMVIYFLF